MEPDKFENYIKSKMGEREISPSKEAWSKISSQLSTEGTKSNRGYFWYGVAASVIVLISLSIIYLNSGIEGDSNEDTIVETPSTVRPEENRKVISEPKQKIIPDAIVFEEGSKNDIISKETKRNTLKINEHGGFLKEKKNKEVALTLGNEKIMDTSRIAVVPEHVLNSKIAEVLVQVDLLELSTEVTDAEVDSLLLKAQEDILRQRLFNPNNTVDAIALLTEVEDELDQSFRDQIFNSLKTGFLKVRTAVADRNN